MYGRFAYFTNSILQEFMKMPGIVHPQVLQGTATFLELWRQPRVAFALIPFIFMQYWW